MQQLCFAWTRRGSFKRNVFVSPGAHTVPFQNALLCFLFFYSIFAVLLAVRFYSVFSMKHPIGNALPTAGPILLPVASQTLTPLYLLTSSQSHTHTFTNMHTMLATFIPGQCIPVTRTVQLKPYKLSETDDLLSAVVEPHTNADRGVLKAESITQHYRRPKH